MKKRNNGVITYLLMLVLLVFTLIGCKTKEPETDNTDMTATPVATEAPTPTTIPVTENDGMREELTAIELSKLMGNGINLGNTMEACGDTSLGFVSDTSKYETLWGAPITTQEIINDMKAAGFDTLRIPVAWATNAMDYKNGNYTITESYLNRVEEIVNYALKADMYVVLNDHWDGGWWGMFGSAKQETRDAAMDLYISMWTQIADRFKDYSDYLILEAANEELGEGLNSDYACPDSGTLSEDERYATAAKVNQVFVDTIRSSGGNNANRFLLIAGYNTGIEPTCDDRFIMPSDTAKNKLLISVHYYNPWGYCGTSSISSWGSEIDYKTQNDTMALMTKFTKQGYGVVFGEYMVAANKDGSVKRNTCDFFNNFLDNCDMYGFVPLLWNTSFRSTELYDEDVKELFKNRSHTAQSTMTEEEVVATAKANIEAAAAAAANNEAAAVVTEAQATDKSYAWIMFNSGDWSISYSVGDIYDPTSKTDGIVAKDVEITGEGTYTVSLDFTGTGAGLANGIVFSALGISNGENLYPGYIINITDLKINGESYSMKGKPYTRSDDGICTRSNIYNNWVSEVPEDARTSDGDTTDTTPNLVDAATVGEIKTMEVTFDYAPAK